MARESSSGWRASLALALASLLTALLVAEVLLRATHLFGARVAFTEPDPDIGYRFTPGSGYWFFAENDHPVSGRINALGWRDHERTRARPAGTFRVAVLGDSFVEAFQVELDSTFASVAERELNGSRTPRAVECMNFGRSGMTTSEESIVLERDVFPCGPDAVMLLFMFGNDIADIAPATTTNPMRPFPRVGADGSITFDRGFAHSRGARVRALINPLKQRSALVSLVAERYNVWRRQPEAAGGAARAPVLARELTLCTAHPDSLYLEQYRLCKRLMADMALRCDARGARLWLMSVPVVRRASELESFRAIDASFDPAFFDRDLAALADTTGAGFIPLAEPFAAAGTRRGVDLFWSHWNYAGHRVAAAELARALAGATAGRDSRP